MKKADAPAVKIAEDVKVHVHLKSNLDLHLEMILVV